MALASVVWVPSVDLGTKRLVPPQPWLGLRLGLRGLRVVLARSRNSCDLAGSFASIWLLSGCLASAFGRAWVQPVVGAWFGFWSAPWGQLDKPACAGMGWLKGESLVGLRPWAGCFCSGHLALDLGVLTGPGLYVLRLPLLHWSLGGAVWSKVPDHSGSHPNWTVWL